MPDFSFLRRRVYTAAKFANQGNCNPRYDTSDIAQESVLQLLHEINSNGLDADEVNESYLQKVGRGNATKLLRNSLAKKRSIRSEDTSIAVDQIKSTEQDPDQSIQAHDDVVQLIKMMGELSIERQLIIYRRYFDKKSIPEIAEESDSSISKVKTEIKNSLRHLKRIMGN